MGVVKPLDDTSLEDYYSRFRSVCEELDLAQLVSTDISSMCPCMLLVSYLASLFGASLVSATGDHSALVSSVGGTCSSSSDPSRGPHPICCLCSFGCGGGCAPGYSRGGGGGHAPSYSVPGYSGRGYGRGQQKCKRTCTAYPITQFVLHACLSPSFRAFISSVFATSIPKSVSEAFSFPSGKL
ncbi:hypothetical protein Acr_23g0015750 [Actinidia rufa]|uniref:Uncharacterized protein n=1 Tax=Actinidia rufa TaxID=165716 RepID=A0A7J0GQV2_9ERIC|nr:hypothetical protein Acr_23g0015750 [Actinidia rufa]